MASQYSHLQFFRRVPNALLARYFALRDAALDVDLPNLKETHVEPVLAAFLTLSAEQQAEFEAEFQDVDASIDEMFETNEQAYIGSLLREIYVALHNDARRLAAMGTRALIEQIMIDNVGDKGSFGKNLAAFEAEGYVSKVQKQILETILDAGHAAIHRVFLPTEEDLNTLIDVTESVVEIVYEQRKKGNLLKGRIPKRPARDDA